MNILESFRKPEASPASSSGLMTFGLPIIGEEEASPAPSSVRLVTPPPGLAPRPASPTPSETASFKIRQEMASEMPNIGSFHDLVRALDAAKFIKQSDDMTAAKKADFAAEADILRRRINKSRRGLLNPHSKKVQYWDLTTMMALVFTATVTPYEVCLGLPTEMGPLFIINLFVNTIFTIDIVVQFFLPVNDISGELIRSHKKLALRYCTTWFWLDVITVLPFDILTLTVRARVASILHFIVYSLSRADPLPTLRCPH